jgi:hypothetical protein
MLNIFSTIFFPSTYNRTKGPYFENLGSTLYDIEFEIALKEAIVAYSRYCPGIYLDVLKKTTKNLSKGNWCPG